MTAKKIIASSIIALALMMASLFIVHERAGNPHVSFPQYLADIVSGYGPEIRINLSEPRTKGKPNSTYSLCPAVLPRAEYSARGFPFYMLNYHENDDFCGTSEKYITMPAIATLLNFSIYFSLNYLALTYIPTLRSLTRNRTDTKS